MLFRSGWLARSVLAAAILVAAAALVIQISWTLHQWNPSIPGILFQVLWPVDKGLLSPVRILSIVALAVLVGRLIPRDAAFMTGRLGWVVVLCGQNSLHVFCLSILLSMLGNILLTFVSRTWWVLLGVNFGGILIMCGLGLLTAWYGADGRLPSRPLRGARPVAAG